MLEAAYVKILKSLTTSSCFCCLIIMKIVSFLKDVRSEMAKVVWPTRQQTIELTVLVLAVSIIIGAYIAGLDFIFTKSVDFLLK